jgi:hypothetical protein
MRIPSLAEIRKALAAAAAAAAVMVAAGLITGSTAAWITGAIATLSTLVVTYLAPANAAPLLAPPLG